MRALLAFAVVPWAMTGCDGVFGLTGGGDNTASDAAGSDAAVPPVDACTGAESWAPVPHLELGTGPNLYDPTLTNDELEVFFVDGGRILTATRSSPTAAFGAVSKVMFDSFTYGNANDPALTLDGLDMVFAAQAPSPGIYESTRDLGSTNWSTPVLIRNVFPTTGFDLSPNGLDLYMRNNGGNLLDFNRVSRIAPFKAPLDLGIAADFPSVTENSLRVYYTENNNILTATRSRLIDSFSNGAPMLVNGAPLMGDDADASAAGGTLILVEPQGSGTAVVLLTRECL